MALEDLTGTTKYIDSLVATNPDGAVDPKSEGDNHIRGIKNAIKNTFPGITGPVTAAQDELNILDGLTATQADLNSITQTPTVNSVPKSGSDSRLAWGWKPAFRGALIYHSTTQNATAGATLILTFDSESYDTDSIHDVVTNPSRLTVPSGVTKVRLSGFVSATGTVGAANTLKIFKNSTTTPNYVGYVEEAITNYIRGAVHTPVLSVTAGDWFVLGYKPTENHTVEGGTSSPSWFAMEIIE